MLVQGINKDMLTVTIESCLPVSSPSMTTRHPDSGSQLNLKKMSIPFFSHLSIKYLFLGSKLCWTFFWPVLDKSACIFDTDD